MSRITPLLALLLCLTAVPALAATGDDPAVLFEHGSFRRAEAVAAQHVAANPADASALAVLARLRANERRYDEAVDLGERAVKAAPRSAEAHYALAEVRGQQARDGGLLHGLGAARALKREAEATLAIDPKHADALALLMEFHRVAPGIAGGDKQKRAEYAARLFAADPERGWFVRAQDALRERDSAKAEQCWRQAVEAAPASGGAKLALAQWLAASRRDIPGAEKLAAGVTEAEPWRIAAWQLVAAVQAHGRRWADLDMTLARSEEAADGRRDAWYAAARQLINDKAEPERAERYLRHFLEREPEPGALTHAAARWRLAMALEQQGRKEEAIAELRTAVKLDPKLEPAKQDLKRLKG